MKLERRLSWHAVWKTAEKSRTTNMERVNTARKEKMKTRVRKKIIQNTTFLKTPMLKLIPL